MLNRLAGRVADRLASHPRMTVAGLGSVAAAVTGVVMRYRQQRGPALPEPGAFGAGTAVAIHNAAKGAIITAVRTADTPEGHLVSDAAGDAVREAMNAGADIAPAAIGAVEGAIEVAHLVGESPLAAGQRAASAAVRAAETLGPVASERVRDVLAPYLEQRTALPAD